MLFLLFILLYYIISNYYYYIVSYIINLFLFFPHECTHIQTILRSIRIHPRLQVESTIAEACQLQAPFSNINAALQVKNLISAEATLVCRLPILVTSKLHMETITNPHLGQIVLGGHPMIAGGMIPIVFCA